MTYSKKQYHEKLEKMGVTADPDASVEELKALYEEVKSVDAGETSDESAPTEDTETTEDPGIDETQEEEITDPDASVEELKDHPADGSPTITVRVTCPRLAQRAHPDRASVMLGVLVQGTVLEVVEHDEEWLEITNQAGYIMREFVEVI